MTIKAIPTNYNGCLFRSRLEARWAVCFDALGIKWHYEMEGFQLPGGWYLPDFYLPQVRMFAEVKPAVFTVPEMKRCIELSEVILNAPDCIYSDHVLMLDGPPDTKEYFSVSARMPYHGFPDQQTFILWDIMEDHKYWEGEHGGRFFFEDMSVERYPLECGLRGHERERAVSLSMRARF